MGKNIIMLSGSPRKSGNTEMLAAAFIKGTESAGHKVTLFQTADLKIGGCLGCGHCFENKGICVQKDDMPPIQRVAMLLTCGNKSEDVNEGAVFLLNRLCDAYGWNKAGVVTVAGLHGRGEIAGRTELDEARALGRDM